MDGHELVRLRSGQALQKLGHAATRVDVAIALRRGSEAAERLWHLGPIGLWSGLSWKPSSSVVERGEITIAEKFEQDEQEPESMLLAFAGVVRLPHPARDGRGVVAQHDLAIRGGELGKVE